MHAEIQSAERHTLSTEIANFMHHKKADFNTLALKLFRYQHKYNTPYQKYVNALGKPDLSHWSEIPAISTNTFKCTPPPCSVSADAASTIFTTSGTTSDTKGTHFFADTKLYESSIKQAWKQLSLPPIENLFILTPSTKDAPHSSLSHMMETLRQQYAPHAPYLISSDQIQIAPLIEACQRNTPITILGTALAFLNLFEKLDTPLHLPKGSWVMETGGYKGSNRMLTKTELYDQFETFLGISKVSIWNEYSMTELSSQFYTHDIHKPHIAPHWVKVRVLDPETDQPVQAGEMGYLVIYDLANIDSVLAVRTQDIAVYHDAHHFTLIGRDPSALPRGCSRSIDATLNQMPI